MRFGGLRLTWDGMDGGSSNNSCNQHYQKQNTYTQTEGMKECQLGGHIVTEGEGLRNNSQHVTVSICGRVHRGGFSLCGNSFTNHFDIFIHFILPLINSISSLQYVCSNPSTNYQIIYNNLKIKKTNKLCTAFVLYYFGIGYYL